MALGLIPRNKAELLRELLNTTAPRGGPERYALTIKGNTSEGGGLAPTTSIDDLLKSLLDAMSLNNASQQQGRGFNVPQTQQFRFDRDPAAREVEVARSFANAAKHPVLSKITSGIFDAVMGLPVSRALGALQRRSPPNFRTAAASKISPFNISSTYR